MEQLITQESTGKIFGFLGTAVFSMFLLFGVSATNASFTAVENPLPNPFAPKNVVAVIDQAANSYAKFIDQNMVMPAEQSYAIAADNIGYLMEEAGPSILAITGFDVLIDVEDFQGQVAGAYIQAEDVSQEAELKDGSLFSEGFSVDVLYSLLVR